MTCLLSGCYFFLKKKIREKSNEENKIVVGR